MKKFRLDLTSKDFTKDDFETIHNYEKDGVVIEINNDCGNWWITKVSVDGEESNFHDMSLDFENLSSNKKIESLLENGLDIESACEEAGAKWIVRINLEDSYIRF